MGAWVEILAGEFLMGAQSLNPEGPNYDPEAREDESPVHPVFLSGYRIGRYPVTVEEYRRFVEDGGYGEALYWRAGGFGKWKELDGWREQIDHPTRPVVGVSWYEASAYCSWMEWRKGFRGCRLPTEAEWERAARGTTGRKYPWGDDPPNGRLANFAVSTWEGGHPTPVGAYPLGDTPEGISDMAGNVCEWCSDAYNRGYYEKSPKKDPKGPDRSGACVLRGGSWYALSEYLRSACRRGNHPECRFGNFGFRVVCVLSPGISTCPLL